MSSDLPKRPVLVVILACLSMLGALSIDAYLPALPTIAHDFTSTLPAVQQTLTVYLATFAVMTLFYGTLSDSFGRRPVILVALCCYCLSSIGAGWAPTLGWLLFFRALQGLSAGAGSVVGQAMVGDLYSGADRQRIMSYVSLVFGMAPALAPILGGWLLSVSGWKFIFFFIASFSFLLLLACLWDLPESLAPEKRHAFHFKVIVKNYIDVGSHAQFLLRSLSMAFAFIGIMVYVAAAPVYLIDQLHLTVREFGWLFVTFIAGMTFGSMASAKLSHQLKPYIIIRISFGFMIVSALASLIYTASFTPRIPWAIIPHFFYGLGISLGSPAMTVLTLELFPHVKGLPSSLQGFIFMVVFALISGALAPLLFGSAFHLAVGAALGLAVSLVLWWLGSRKEPDHPVLADEDQQFVEETSHF